jgi:hypothetical protein
MPSWLQITLYFVMFIWGFVQGRKDADDRLKRANTKLLIQIAQLKRHIIEIKWDVEEACGQQEPHA